jgi:hypothetical protein
VNTDEFLEQMERDEFEGAEKLTPIEYGKLRGRSGQNIYYHIRAGHIELETCQCGRKVVDVKAADDYFASKEKNNVGSKEVSERSSDV